MHDILCMVFNKETFLFFYLKMTQSSTKESRDPWAGKTSCVEPTERLLANGKHILQSYWKTERSAG